MMQSLNIPKNEYKNSLITALWEIDIRSIDAIRNLFKQYGYPLGKPSEEENYHLKNATLSLKLDCYNIFKEILNYTTDLSKPISQKINQTPSQKRKQANKQRKELAALRFQNEEDDLSRILPWINSKVMWRGIKFHLDSKQLLPCISEWGPINHKPSIEEKIYFAAAYDLAMRIMMGKWTHFGFCHHCDKLNIHNHMDDKIWRLFFRRPGNLYCGSRACESIRRRCKRKPFLRKNTKNSE